MTEPPSDRWRRLERLYHQTLAVPSSERASFLRHACPDDTDIAREVAGLLELEAESRGFLERPALEEAAALMTLTRGTFTGRRIGHYDVVSLLGAGGMGEVYLARDRRLERDVALKILHVAATTDALNLRRFEEEARAASILNHTNIVTIFGVGEEDGVAFIEMERVHGCTLREHMADRPLLVADLLDVAIQLADALTHAHQNGIIHRDLKPDNVMMTPDGVVKVLDFGIAKRGIGMERPSGRADADPPGTVTLQGAILGTVGYMSPEQAAGQPVRPASDQFSLGAILYELATGQRAFEGNTPTATIDAILHEEPTPIRRLQPAVPPALQQIVERCLAKQPEARFAATRDLADALKRVRAVREHAARMLAIWRRAGRIALASMVILVLGGLAAWRLWWHEPPRIPFAVLPFSTVEADDDIAYLGEGIADALNQRLRGLPRLDVISSEKALSFANATVLPEDVSQPLDTQTIADLKDLDVDMVLTGSVETADKRLRIKAALVGVASGEVIWTHTFFDREDRRDLQDWMANAAVGVQDEIAKAVIGGLNLPASEDVLNHLTARPTRDNIAYDLYLRGLYLVRRGAPLEARGLFDRAMHLDERFAAVRVAFASTYWTMLIDGDIKPTDGWKRVNTAVDEALRLAPGLPEAHAGRAMSMFLFDHNWAGAEVEFETARRLSTRDIKPETYFGYAFLQWAIGKPQRALDFIRSARKLNPFDPEIKRKQADYHLHLGQLEDAAALYRQVIDDDPADTDAMFGLAEVQKRRRRYDEAIETWRGAHEILETAALIPSLATARGEAGLRAIEHEAALLDVRTYEERASDNVYVSPYELARAYARAGMRAKALDLLEDAERENSPGLVFIGADRSWDALRGEPRFRAVLESVGLPKQQ